MYQFVSWEFMTTKLLMFRCIRLWSVTVNESSLGKIGHEEVGSLHCEMRQSIDLYELV